VGAQALGLAEQYGTIEPGKKAALMAVRLRAAEPGRRFGETDVEEYLVGGNVRAPHDVRLIRSH
jgi:cytosine/adenosine deaminase-related metal-dependent hydrolase